MSYRNNKYHKNTGPVPNWSRFFNRWKNPEYFYLGGFSPVIKEEFSQNNIKSIPQQNKNVDKTTNIKQLKCNRYEN